MRGLHEEGGDPLWERCTVSTRSDRALKRGLVYNLNCRSDPEAHNTHVIGQKL